MSVAPTNPYLNVFKEETGQVTKAVKLFPGSVETVTISDATSADYTKTVASQTQFEVRPYTLVNVAVNSGHYTIDATLTIDKNFKQPGDAVEFKWTVADIVTGRTLYLKDDAATPNTLATITLTSEGNRTTSSRRFVLGATGTWTDTSVAPASTTANVSFGNVAASGSVKSSSATGGVGYATGAGIAVTAQATSKSTTVAGNGMCGTITTHNATLNASTSVSFTFTNTAIASGDVVLFSLASGGTASSYFIQAGSIGTGTMTVHLRNVSAGNLGEALVINFVVIRGVSA